jgi:hypothetical protein
VLKCERNERSGSNTGILFASGLVLCRQADPHFVVINNVHFLIFYIFKKQQNELIEMQYNRIQKTLHIWCQLLHVSAPKCQHQRADHQQKCVDPTRNSSTIRPHLHSHYRQNFPSGLHYKILQLMQASLKQSENYEGKIKM